MQGSKFVRQRMLHEAVAELLRANPQYLRDPRVQVRLEQTRRGVSGELYESCVDQWARLLRQEDVELILREVLADGDQGAMMRTTSPLSVLLTPEQRQAVIAKASGSLVAA